MAKQTKTIKFMLFLLMIIPIILFSVGIIQTFVLKSKQNELANANYVLDQKIQTEQELQNEADYKSSDEYKYEYQKYFNNKSEDEDILVKKR